MEKSERKRKKRSTGKVMLICLSLIFVVYIGINIAVNYGGSIKTYSAKNGEEAESVIVDGFIFKDQTVILANESGYLECVVPDAGRVCLGGTVAYIYEDKVDAASKNRVLEIDEKIREIEENNRSISASESDAVRLEKDIAEAVSGIPVLVRNCDMEALRDTRESLNEIVEAKQKIAGDDPSGEEALKALRAEKQELEGKNNMAKTPVKVGKAGSFTAVTDGYEEILDDGKLENLTQSYLENIEIEEKKSETGDKVEKGEAIGKIVDTYTWYFAFVADKDVADTMKINDTVRLKFLDSSDNIINGSVYDIRDEKRDKAVIVISSSEYVDNLYSMSEARVEVIRKTYEGIKIPSESVRVKDGKKGVYIVSGKTVKFRDAKVYYIGEEWAIVSKEEKNGIKLYDEVIVGGSNIYEGKVVR